MATSFVELQAQNNSIELSRGRAVAGGEAVTIEVADSGMGIIEEFLPFIFEPFRRSDRAQTYPGLGIGLSIAAAHRSAWRNDPGDERRRGQRGDVHGELPVL